MPNPNVARNVWFVREFPFQPEGRANVLLGQVFRWRVTFLPWLRFLRGLVGNWLSKRAGNSPTRVFLRTSAGRGRSSVHSRTPRRSPAIGSTTRTAGDYGTFSDRILSFLPGTVLGISRHDPAGRQTLRASERAGMSAALPVDMGRPAVRTFGRALSLLLAGCTLILAGCTLSRPHYVMPDVRVGEPAFVRALEAHTLSSPVDGNRAQVLLNGNEIFPTMLAAIRGAKTTITFANFLYEDGDIAGEMATALAKRCRAGVRVNVLLDAVGSSQMPRQYWTILKDAGCQVAWYHSFNPFAVTRINHRNHRRILVVDGRVGFTGGTGVGEQWTGDGRQPKHWRQTDVRVEGPIVRFLQSAFAENWRDATGTLLGGDAYFPEPQRRGTLAIQSVKSSPASGAAEAYLLFLLAIDGPA